LPYNTNIMEVHFSLPFITFPGQEIHITGSTEELEEGQKNNHIKSFYSEGVCCNQS